MADPPPDVGSVDDPLDNMAWHALVGPHADLAERSDNGRAARYRRTVSPIGAVGEVDHEAWIGLRQLVGERGYASFFRAEPVDAPPDWKQVFTEEVTQYVADDLPDGPEVGGDIVELTAGGGGPANAEEMLALATLTEPGPFEIDTHRLGTYFGLRRHGELIAMAGERLRCAGWGEVSAVCVHPSARGEGLGAALTLVAAHHIRDRGDEAMLHVRDGNDPAHALYRKLGFRARRIINVGVFRFIG